MKILLKPICLLLAAVLAAAGLSGCHIARTEPQICRVVTEISVVHRIGDASSSRSYSDPKKMELFLTYLRLLKPHVPARADPEATVGDSYRITLRFSDGSEKSYYQHGERYLSEDCQPWREIDPEFAVNLDKLFRSTPADS